MGTKDILLDSDNDMTISGGDIVVGESTLQHQKLLIVSNKGEWKQNPACCVGAANYIECRNDGSLCREIRTEFTKDGMTVTTIKVDFPKIEVEAKYED